MSRALRWVLVAFVAVFSLFPQPGVGGVAGPTGALQWGRRPWDRGLHASEVTHPSRLVGESSGREISKQELDTRARKEPPGGPPVHLAQVSFLVPAFGWNFTLDLELNHHLLASHYVERHFSSDGTTQHSTGAGDHCYYQGKLRDNPGSFAAISTCQGLHGVFSDGNFTYTLEPQGEASKGPLPHLIHRTSLLPVPGCREPGCLFAAPSLPVPPALPRLRRKRQVRRGHSTVHSETKYVELIVINDHQLFEQLRQSVVLTSNFAKSVVNLADVLYKDQLNTRIVLVAMETWAGGDKIQVQDDPLETLARLMVYRREGLPEPSDATHLFSGRTFQNARSGTAYVGGICSQSRGGGVNEYGTVAYVAVTLAQTLGQNLGMMWNKHRSSAGECKCPDTWQGCMMEDTGHYLPQKFSRCSLEEYSQFLQEGGGSCLFNKPLKLLDPPECGNGFVEAGEECDCGSVQVSVARAAREVGQGRGLSRLLLASSPVPSGPLPLPLPLFSQECNRAGGNCCKKCTLTHDAMCSDGLCCRGCKYEPRGVSCREAVNECDIAETCTGDSSQCPPNLHKLDGYYCEQEQGRCYGGRCKTRDKQCRALWGHNAADRYCYERLNVEGTDRGNCGRKGSGWVQCSKQDVLCGFLLCVNISGGPRLGDLGGDISSITFYHQGRELDCRGGHVELADGSDLSYVEDGTPCGPNMLCLDHHCLPASAFNFSSCPGSAGRRICSDHGVCSNEGKCICQPDWTGKDCSVYNPMPTSPPTEETERYKGPSGTNIIIGSIAGAVLVAAIVLGGTGWGFKNIRRGRSGGA
ncbi:disintegrin and metalloproteinase domain-containing protein 11 isoform X2 [Monodelphis domestica]|uniref:disintegrin and metalloproteinase domain-containing protein 11 isoform X2 n=1 Tax=Monodelphis domestica TaxID=13616 RepID=UPI0024E236E1|nr:disintegrin and metalloproteinase domain-containing protein 11 isoform X2 [Monodelphis domestica]